MGENSKPITELPSNDVQTLSSLESSSLLTFPTFTTSTAWSLGVSLRSRILSLPPAQRKPALISISLGSNNGAAGAESNCYYYSPHVVFQCATEPGTVPDNDVWVRRKRNTVLRFGASSWLMRCKMAGAGTGLEGADLEVAFARKYALSSPGHGVSSDYAIHGGGFPIRVKGVEGVIGVVVVSGLKQEHDHQVIVEVVRDFIQQSSQ